MKEIKWFPGHMKKAIEDIEENRIKLADAILYVLDSRAPISCMNPNVKKIVHNKPIIYVFNKIDLADMKKVKAIQKELEDAGNKTVTISASDKNFKPVIKNAIKQILSEKMARNESKNLKATYKILVLGVPNTGKSSLINMMSSSKKAITGNIAGVTKANQWVKIDDELIMLDTPGVLWPKFDETISKNLAYIGCLSDNEFDLSDLGYEVMKIIYENYPENLKARFNIDWLAEENTKSINEEDFNYEDFYADEFLQIYDKLCLKRGYIMRKNEIDYQRAGKCFLDEFRSGKLGGITLD